MNDLTCARVRELLPDVATGRASGDEAATVSAHLEACAECGAEALLVGLLAESRPDVPAGLAERIHGAVHRPPERHPWWGLAAAAVAALAVGIGVTSRGADTALEVPAYMADAEESAVWLSDDGLIAGAPAFDGLSDDDLRLLLEEMTTGGAA